MFLKILKPKKYAIENLSLGQVDKGLNAKYGASNFRHCFLFQRYLIYYIEVPSSHCT